jgi:hypothetical protein
MPEARDRAEKLVPAWGDADGRQEVVDAVAEDLSAAQGDGSHLGDWGRLPADSEASKARAPNAPPSGEFVQRYVDVPCPSGKHQRSMLTFRSHAVACMFCIPCEHGWAEPTTHPALTDVAIDTPR